MPNTSSSGVRVLVIDDSEIVLDAARSILEAEGCQVETRSIAYGSAWAIVERRPDVVLVDVNMPGLRGQDIISIARARDELEQTRILLFSSESDTTLAALAEQCGADGWVRKEGDHAGLAEAVRRHAVRRSEPPPPPPPPPCAGEAVLFVDHEEAMLEYYRDLFKSTLSSVEFATSGRVALRHLDNNTPRLVVCEIELPRFSGAEFYRRAVQRDPIWRDRFLFTTRAASELEWVADFINGLDAAVLHKPIKRAHLTNVVNRRLAATHRA